MFMMARIADDEDFQKLKNLIDCINGWSLELTKGETSVWTKNVDDCNFRMIKIQSTFDTDANTLFDVLLDPNYRKIWDTHIIDSHEIGVFNVNNDVGYYAMSCPAPLRPRDFVLQRSWLDTHTEKMLISRSVFHRGYPPRKGIVRATSHITGFVIRPHPSMENGCFLGYVAHCDPQGKLPSWLVNKVTHTLGPRMINDLKKAAQGYQQWKLYNSNNFKPWRFPEHITSDRISVNDICFKVPALPDQNELSLKVEQSNVKNINASSHDNENKIDKKKSRFKFKTPFQDLHKSYPTL